jgi:hypothetical protein
VHTLRLSHSVEVGYAYRHALGKQYTEEFVRFESDSAFTPNESAPKGHVVH